METTKRADLPETPAANQWYEDNAKSFVDIEVIEKVFLGRPAAERRRLNAFKLAALDRPELVDFTGRSVIDFGAGHARLAIAHPEMSRYVGVDNSPKLAALGTERLARAGLASKAEMLVSSVLEFESAERFDVVCSLGMLTYFESPWAVIKRMRGFVTPGGTLFFDFRVDSPLYSTIRRIKWALRPPTGGASYVIDPDGLKTFLTSLGASNIKIVGREYPLLADKYASGSDWPIRLRDRLAASRAALPLATEAWVFARIE